MKRKYKNPLNKNKHKLKKKTTSIEKIREIMELLNLNSTSYKEKIDNIKEKGKINLNNADDNTQNIKITSSPKKSEEINNSTKKKKLFLLRIILKCQF